MDKRNKLYRINKFMFIIKDIDTISRDKLTMLITKYVGGSDQTIKSTLSLMFKLGYIKEIEENQFKVNYNIDWDKFEDFVTYGESESD